MQYPYIRYKVQLSIMVIINLGILNMFNFLCVHKYANTLCIIVLKELHDFPNYVNMCTCMYISMFVLVYANMCVCNREDLLHTHSHFPFS